MTTGCVDRLRLRPDAVDSAGPLFECARVPGEVVVDHVAAVLLQVDALSHHRARHQHLGEERGVEGQHEAPSCGMAHQAVGEPDVGHQHLSVPRAFRRVEVLGGGGDAAGLDAGQGG